MKQRDIQPTCVWACATFLGTAIMTLSPTNLGSAKCRTLFATSNLTAGITVSIYTHRHTHTPAEAMKSVKVFFFLRYFPSSYLSVRGESENICERIASTVIMCSRSLYLHRNRFANYKRRCSSMWCASSSFGLALNNAIAIKVNMN